MWGRLCWVLELVVCVEGGWVRLSVCVDWCQVKKCGSRIWSEVTDLARLIREGETKWEDLDLDDVDVRLKWAGLFHRRKRHPGTFMMRVKVFE